MNINYNYYNKQLLINQLIEQTKFNLARLTSLENIVNKLVKSEGLDKLVNGYYMFSYNSIFNGSNITGLISNSKLNKLLNCCSMFSLCGSLKEISLPNATFENLINGFEMFNYCTSLTTLLLPNATFENVINGYQIFKNCSSLKEISLPNATFENVTDARNMFNMCSSLTTLLLPNATFENVINTYSMFNYCESLKEISLPNATFENVTDATNMFGNCSKLTNLDISSATFNNVSMETLNDFFEEIPSNCKVYIPETTYNKLVKGTGPFSSGWTAYDTDDKGGFTQKQ